jgi:hypothetical protein
MAQVDLFMLIPLNGYTKRLGKHSETAWLRSQEQKKKVRIRLALFSG